jgi:SNF2 family DNA or RNA helicase
MASHSAIAPSAQDEKSKSPAQTPRPHQLEAETFCWESQRVILADDMGVGKTLPAIRAATGRIIVICPTTVKANWRREILREKPHARLLILSGTVPSTIEPDVDFAVLNYDIAEAWQD